MLAAAVVAGFVAIQWGDRLATPGLGDQLGHVLLYYLLGLALWRVLPRGDALARAGAVVSTGLLLSIVMESGQASFRHRTPDEADVLADLVGLVMAVLPLAWASQSQEEQNGRAGHE